MLTPHTHTSPNKNQNTLKQVHHLVDLARWLSEKCLPCKHETLLPSVPRTHTKVKKGWCGCECCGEGGFLWLTFYLASSRPVKEPVLKKKKESEDSTRGCPLTTICMCSHINIHTPRKKNCDRHSDVLRPSHCPLLPLWPQSKWFGRETRTIY